MDMTELEKDNTLIWTEKTDDIFSEVNAILPLPGTRPNPAQIRNMNTDRRIEIFDYGDEAAVDRNADYIMSIINYVTTRTRHVNSISSTLMKSFVILPATAECVKRLSANKITHYVIFDPAMPITEEAKHTIAQSKKSESHPYSIILNMTAADSILDIYESVLKPVTNPTEVIYPEAYARYAHHLLKYMKTYSVRPMLDGHRDAQGCVWIDRDGHVCFRSLGMINYTEYTKILHKAGIPESARDCMANNGDFVTIPRTSLENLKYMITNDGTTEAKNILDELLSRAFDGPGPY